jgi:hypothetical protein
MTRLHDTVCLRKFSIAMEPTDLTVTPVTGGGISLLTVRFSLSTLTVFSYFRLHLLREVFPSVKKIFPIRFYLLLAIRK